MRAYVFAFLTMLFWGLSPALEKIGVSKLTPLTAVSMRSFFVAAILLVLFFATGGHIEVAKEPSTLIYVLIGGIFAGLLGQLTYFAALKTGEISRVVPIVASYPVIAFVIGLIFFNEAITLPKAIGTVFVIVGVLLLR